MSAEPPSAEGAWDELEQLYSAALEVLAGLDRLGLYQAGAHLSMALDIMRRQHPLLMLSEPDNRRSLPPHDP